MLQQNVRSDGHSFPPTVATQTFVPLINSVVDHSRIIVPETQDYAKASSAGQRLVPVDSNK